MLSDFAKEAETELLRLKSRALTKCQKERH